MGDRTTAPSRPWRRLLPAIAGSLVLAACGGGAGPGDVEPVPARASEAEWRALAEPRPEPLDGATRLSIGEFQVLASPSWAATAAVHAELGMAELVAAGLLRRRDVHFVERRRFSAAAARERQGLPRPAGAPPAGVSPGAELLVNVSWASLGMDSTYVDVRLVEARTGGVAYGTRAGVPEGADPVSVARRVVGSVTELLRDAGRLPSWSDPAAAAATAAHQPSGLPPEAAVAFFQGLAAEERWDWEGARRGYQAALRSSPSFVEAEAALARAARLRSGGTLGAN